MNFNNHGVIVPDISFYQDDDTTPGKVDFAKMKAAGAVGVILRGGQNAWVDEDFQDYKRDAKAAGMPRGYYWFYDSRKDPGQQANLWRAAIGDDLPELGLWYDFEDSYNGAYKSEAYRKQFALAMDAFFPNSRRGVYTARWWWDSQNLLDILFWSRYPLWVAQYNVAQADIILPRPWVGREPLFWQFTSHGDGAKYGVESANIDLNYFNGDTARFQQLFGLGGTTPPTEPETGETMQGRVKTFTNIRLDRNKNSADMGDLLAGDIVTWTEEYAGTDGLTWIKLISATHNGAPVRCSDGNTVTGRYCWANNVEEIPQPPAQELPNRFALSVDGVSWKWYVAE